MKKIFGALLALYSAVALSATLNPVQLINPAGSTSGQAIVSTGASSAPAWGGVGLNGIAAIAANTVLANASASSAAPAAFSMPSCSTSASALNWTTSTGFTCNTAVNAAQLGGATFAAPGPIGSTTASTGAFTTLSASSTVSGTGFSTYLASPPAIGGTAAAAGSFTTLAASGNDALFYQNTSAQSIANSTTTTVTTWTKVFDRLNANFNATTGTFTAPATAIYRVDMHLEFNAGAGTVGAAYSCVVNANGTAVAQGLFRQEVSVAGVAKYCQVHTLVSLTSGQTILFQAFQNSGAATPLSSTGNTNYIAIQRIP